MQVKKVYNGLIAYLAVDGIAVLIGGIVLLILGLTGSFPAAEELGVWGYIGMIAIGALLTAFTFWWVKSRSPKEYFVKNYLMCLKTGLIWAVKIALYCCLILIPLGIKIGTGYAYTGYDEYGNETWLKHIEGNEYEAPDGKRYIMKG